MKREAVILSGGKTVCLRGLLPLSHIDYGMCGKGGVYATHRVVARDEPGQLTWLIVVGCKPLEGGS